MARHTCTRGHDGVLADGCPRCAEIADERLSYSLSRNKMAELWAEMIHREFAPRQIGAYASELDAKAAVDLYDLALWLRRYTTIDPRDLQLRTAPITITRTPS